MKNIDNTIAYVLLSAIILTPVSASAASNSPNSPQIIAIQGKPAQAKVKTLYNECITTREQIYSVSAATTQDAYPDCPPNTTISKVNLRTDKTLFVDVVTFVSLVCCKQATTWEKVG